MDLDHLTNRFSNRVDELRDRTAGVLSAEDQPVMSEVRRLRERFDDRFDGLERKVTDRVTALADEQSERLDHLFTKRTTWPRRLFWVAAGMAAGAATSFLADPDRGRQRRTMLTEQITTRGRELAEEAGTRVSEFTEQAKETISERLDDGSVTDDAMSGYHR
jgi:hypothetical protein